MKLNYRGEEALSRFDLIEAIWSKRFCVYHFPQAKTSVALIYKRRNLHGNPGNDPIFPRKLFGLRTVPTLVTPVCLECLVRKFGPVRAVAITEIVKREHWRERSIKRQRRKKHGRRNKNLKFPS